MKIAVKHVPALFRIVASGSHEGDGWQPKITHFYEKFTFSNQNIQHVYVHDGSYCNDFMQQ